jgi:myo-inositol catabolism protein IolS
MEYGTLGWTGIKVSEVGFGACAIGGDARGAVEDRESVAAIRRAMELGVILIDTADDYGDGRSEELVAEATRGRREQVVISTKGGLMRSKARDRRAAALTDRP